MANISLRVSAEQSCTVLFDRLPALDNEALTLALDRWVGPCYVDVSRMASSALMAGAGNFDIHRVVLLPLPAPRSKEAGGRSGEISLQPEEARLAVKGHRAAGRLPQLGR